MANRVAIPSNEQADTPARSATTAASGTPCPARSDLSELAGQRGRVLNLRGLQLPAMQPARKYKFLTILYRCLYFTRCESSDA